MISAGKCQQYGHSCLGGHGKRSQEQERMGLLQNNQFTRNNIPLSNRMLALLHQVIAQRFSSLQSSQTDFPKYGSTDINTVENYENDK